MGSLNCFSVIENGELYITDSIAVFDISNISMNI